MKQAAGRKFIIMTDKQKVAFITGASGGIGSACALALAKNGEGVGIHYHLNRDGAVKTLRSCAAYTDRVAAYSADLCKSEQVKRIADAFMAEFGVPDDLILCAGAAGQMLFQDTTDEEYDRLMDSNVRSAFLTIRAFLPAMISEKKGNIVLISSMWGQVGGSCEVVYSAAKAALIGMTKALAKEVAPSGIRVNCVCPGVILTPMVENLGEETLASLAEDTPLGRNGLPEDVANAVLYLSTEGASFITGQILPVNGGLVI